MNNIEKEADEIVIDICKNVLKECLIDGGIEEYGTVGMDMNDPKDVLTVALCALSSKD